jgi:hypothetical protein
MVDFKAMKAAAKAKQTSAGLCAAVIGAGQTGKSTLLGTLPGTLLIIHTADESHGVESAKIYNKNVVGLCVNPEGVSADESIETLFSVLSQEDLRDHFDNVAVDSFSSFEALIKSSDGFKNSCKSPSTGKYDKFSESGNLLAKLQEIVSATGGFRDKGGNFLATLPAHVKAVDADGGAETVEPMLSTYGVANSVPRMFHQVLFVTQATVEGEKRRVLDFNTEAQKNSKEKSGSINKMLNFKSCIRGVPDSELPEVFPADLAKLLKFIEGIKGE